ncbi:MAG: sugar phosphate isomerase/epimerase family protein [Planctomycetota bacterium]
MSESPMSRRRFLGASLATAATIGLPKQTAAAGTSSDKHICAFIKYVQSLSYDDMAEAIAELGFDGIESTVRGRGHVLPERVEEDLPKQVEAVRREGIDVTLITTDVRSVDQPLTQRVLRTAADLGVKKYRMGFYIYDPQRDIQPQLSTIRERFKELADLNRELGITAVYQNHAGAQYVGAPIWDLGELLRDIPADEIGMAFDIRHATVEGGLAWPLHYRRMAPHVGAVVVKDFDWQASSPRHVPLGQGRVDKRFFQLHRESGIDCPISLHVEYLGGSGAKENLAALKRDLAVLRKWAAV